MLFESPESIRRLQQGALLCLVLGQNVIVHPVVRKKSLATETRPPVEYLVTQGMALDNLRIVVDEMLVE